MKVNPSMALSLDFVKLLGKVTVHFLPCLFVRKSCDLKTIKNILERAENSCFIKYANCMAHKSKNC